MARLWRNVTLTSPVGRTCAIRIPPGVFVTEFTVAHSLTTGIRLTVRLCDAPGARLAIVPTTKSSPVKPGVPLSSVTLMFVRTLPPVFVTVYVYVTAANGVVAEGLGDFVSRIDGGAGGATVTEQLTVPVFPAESLTVTV